MRGRALLASAISVVVACAAYSAPATAASTASVMHLGSPLSGAQALNLGATPVGGGYVRQRWAVDGKTLTVVGPPGTTISLSPVRKDARGRSSVSMGILAPPITRGLAAASRAGVLRRAGLSPYTVARLAGIHNARAFRSLRASATSYYKGETMHIVCASWGTYPTSMQNCDTSYFIQYGQGPCCEVGDAESAFGQNWAHQRKVDALQAESWWNYGDAHTFTERPTVVFNVGPCSSSTFGITLANFTFGFQSTTCSGQIYPLSKYRSSTLIGWGAGYKNTNDVQNGSEGLSPTYGSTVGWSEQQFSWVYMQYQ